MLRSAGPDQALDVMNILETMYKGVAEKMLGVIMNSPYSSCNKRWIWKMANVYHHHLKKDVRSAYTRKQRREGK